IKANANVNIEIIFHSPSVITMPTYFKKRRQMIQLTANCEKTKKIKRVTDFLECLDNKDLNNVLDLIYNAKKQKSLTNSKNNLTELIQSLNNEKKKNTIKLLENMKYSKGKNKGKIISPYLQQQLVEVISTSLYRSQSSYTALQKE
ncbi:5838_t:CDS:1, partial [Dentiscutata erythropus]